MITTRQINVNLAKEKLKLRQVTTKNVDPSLRVEPPKAKIKPRGVTTTTQPDVADIAEKKRRDDIAIEKKLMMKDEKKILLVDNEGDSVVAFIDEVGFKKLNMQFIFADVDNLIQAISRRELK